MTKEEKEIKLKFAIDRLCRLREKQKNIDWGIEDAKNEIREISPDNVYLTI